MHSCCPAHAFSGCCEGRECQSAAVPLINLAAKLERKTVPLFSVTFRDYLAVFTFVFSLAVIVGGSIKLNDHYKHEALDKQEITAWRK
ncbi:hypothetical protein [Neorhizobium sp. SOG26]|uniref:hypothetical protein n=1 Tax=Neorhizobium sp. SOG26 TaxID=2060726 RepID=UPI00190155F6|nr:hypothetical protein [Neorhizobium sp. SOG26]